MTITIHHGNCLDVMAAMPEASVDAIVTDPPYGLGFMGKQWDDLPPGLEFAREALRVLKPGGHMLAFGGTRTWHRLAVAVEDAGFEIRDSIAWLYGSGFPKSMDVAQAIDKAARGVPQGGADPTSANHGNYRTSKTEGKRWDSDKGQGFGAGGSAFLTSTASERTARPSSAETAGGSQARTLDATATDWQGWGTALKPAFEPIVVARKPLIGTVAANVLAHGTGALNIDATRIETSDDLNGGAYAEVGGREVSNSLRQGGGMNQPGKTVGKGFVQPSGRFPANVILDESQAAELDRQTGTLTSGIMRAGTARRGNANVYGTDDRPVRADTHGDSGGASRFFYVAKAPKSERPIVEGVAHPTVKPLALMRYLVRLVTPPGGVVLDPFAGSGTTLDAAKIEGFAAVGIEREADYLPLIDARLARHDQVAAEPEDDDMLDIFGGTA